MTTPDAGNRRERKKLAVRWLIRQTAFRLFDEHGYANVTVERISDAADVSAVTFYRHFQTKEGVVISVAMTPRLSRAILALPSLQSPADVARLLDELFADADEWTDDLARRLRLIHATPELTDALWQRSSRWADAVAVGFPATLRGRIAARCLVSAALECGLAWAAGSAGPDLRASLASVLMPIVPGLIAYGGSVPTG